MTEPKRLVRLSKYMALLLRHNPGVADLELDPNGWVGVEELLERMNATGHPITIDDLNTIVTGSRKARYELDGDRIRAAQGHSVPVDLGLEPTPPPPLLYHGTVGRSLDAILADGLDKQRRTHVHLSGDIETARIVGARRGKPVVLTVDAGRMHRDGYRFTVAANGVWLVDHVPVDYISQPG